PLLTPLRRARDAAALSAPGWTRAVAFAAAFDAPRLSADLRAALAALAAERWPESAPDRRALEAELHELADDALAALDALGEAAHTLHAAGEGAADGDVDPVRDRVRHAAWRVWTAALGRAFAAADRCWLAALPALADSRGGEGRLWRRVLRRP